MQRPLILILFAIGIGAVVTAATATAALIASRSGSEALSEAIFWPNTLLQAVVPAPNIGTLDHPRYEGTPLNILAFFASFPFATCAYAGLAYLCCDARRPKQPLLHPS